MKFTTNILLISFFLPLTALKAQYNNIEFVENKGQWDSKIKFAGKVNAGAFYVEQKGFQVLQHNVEDWKKITETVHDHHGGKSDIGSKLTLRSHAYQVQFVNGNENPEIIPDKSLPGYNNYFLGDDPSKWASECKIYQGITMKNIYPNVDVRYYTSNGLMKYDIIVHPGGDISRIAMKYSGADKLELKNKELIIATSVGNLKELNPYTYQNNDKGRKEVSAKFILKNNLVSFDVKDYDRNTTLIIDPTLIFCSFTGSTADNWGFTATYGPDGSMYGGGIVFFNNGFPVSVGAFQTIFQGGDPAGFSYGPFDMGIIKLTPDGSTRVYATYIGGSAGNELPASMICDGQGNLVILGRTNSSNYPTTSANNVGVTNPTGGWDIVVTKLNAGGTALIGSKKIGGTGDDGSNITPYSNQTLPTPPGGPISLQQNYGDEARGEVILDNAGNIFVASCAQSTNFPLASAFQNTNAGGNNGQDAVVLKFPPDVSTLLFSSYLGGNGNDAAYVMDISPTTGHLYVAGGTESSSASFPGNHAGTIGTTNQGGIDGFVAEISGTSLVRSTFIGTSGTDQVYGLKFDKFGFPYIMGQTTGTWQVVNAAYFNTGAKQFISKLQPDLSANVYSTTFGSPNATLPNISPTAFLVDRCQNVYVSGWGGCFACAPPASPLTSWYPNTGTLNSMPVTPDAIKPTSDTHDFYFFVLKRDATTILYGSFFGENNLGLNGSDHVDGGTSRFDANGVIYQAICANCQLGDNAVFPTTPGAWSTSNNSPNCNLAMLKMNFNLAGVGADVVSEINGVVDDSSGCVPLTVQFLDSIANAVTYEWHFGDASPMLITNTPNATHTFNAVGNYLVMLVAVDSASCNIRDTSYINIKVGALQALPNFNSVKLLPCDSFKYRFDNISVPPPIAPFGNTSFIWDFGDGSPRTTAGAAPVFHNYPAPGTYNVKLFLNDTTYCNSPDSIIKQITIAASVKAKFTTPPSGCIPYTAVLNNTSTAGQTFQWDFGDGNTSTSMNPTHLYPTAGTYTITLVANDPSTCNVTDTFRYTITVYGLPIANFSFVPAPPIANTPATFTNLSSPDAIRFLWQFGDGDSLLTLSRANVIHQYRATGTFNACLIAWNAGGCPDTICKQVATLVIPAVDVPNAFTPLSGDQNNTVLVRGYGIVKMKFMIWNRWGQKVFESSDIYSGWNGKFKGALQPMDVYAYTLDVEFFDGTKATKKGDITLIR